MKIRHMLNRLVRRLSRFAWHEVLFDVGRIEWRYGRYESGKPKQWGDWEAVRDHLRETGYLRQPEELLITPASAAEDQP